MRGFCRGRGRAADSIDVYPGIKISTLPEMFDFVQCSTDEPVLFNIESKINPDFQNETRSPQDFVDIMGEVFVSRGEDVLKRITHQSFDVSLCSENPQHALQSTPESLIWLMCSGALSSCPSSSILPC